MASKQKRANKEKKFVVYHEETTTAVVVTTQKRSRKKFCYVRRHRGPFPMRFNNIFANNNNNRKWAKPNAKIIQNNTTQVERL